MPEEHDRDPDLKPTLDSRLRDPEDTGTNVEEGEALTDVVLPRGQASPVETDKTIGPYRILGEIGRGGMGVVYKAFDSKLNRNVALKVLIAGEDASEDSIARFRREAEAVARLGHHPNIVPVYDVGHAGAAGRSSLHYIAMHFVEGRSLDRVIDEGGIALREAAEIALKLARALAHAHAHGILHRDIKPSNVLMSRSATEIPKPDAGSGESECPGGASGGSGSEPLLTDFGLAKDVESETKVTRSGVTLGTPQYMPPEQADGRLDDVDERSDVYSLGATLYEMLTASPPFDGESPFRIVHKVLLHDPVAPRRRNPMVDRDLETVCLKCIEKDPERRYATARELAEDLDRYLRGDAVQARPAGPAYRLYRKARRNKTVVVLAAVFFTILAAGAIIGAGMLSWEAGKTDAERTRGEEDRRLAEKRDRVSKVLLGAYGILGDVHRDLKRRSFGEERSEEERQRDFRAHEKSIESFRGTVPEAPDARSVFLAVEGWLRLVGGFTRQAEVLFERSRNEDGEVAWPDLFEALGLLVKYTVLQPLPEVVMRPGGPVFGDLPGETAEMGRVRERFEALLASAADKPIGGKEAARLREVLEAYRGFQERDLSRAEEGLTEALSHWAMVWMREEILIARAKFRYLRLDFDGALEDVLEHLRGAPESRSGHNYAGLVRIAIALRAYGAGQDPEPIYRDALESLDEAIRLGPSTALLNTRGNALRGLADFLSGMGRDSGDLYRRALADFDEALRREPGLVHALNNRGMVRLNMGASEEQLGGDPRPLFEDAIRDLSTALERMPSHASVMGNRGMVFFRLGRYEKKHGLDPLPHLEKAVLDLTRAIEIESGQPGLHAVRAQCHLDRGEWQAGTGKDPTASYAEARKDFDAALERDPKDFSALSHRGVLYASIGEWEMLHGRDSRENFVRALGDFEAALEIDPVHVGTLVNRAGALRRLGEAQASRGVDPRPTYRKAIESCDQALSRDSESASAHFHLAAILLNLAEHEMMRGADPRELLRRAVVSAGEAIRLDPQSVNAYVNRGNGWRGIGDAQFLRGVDPLESYRNALADFETALSKKPENVTVLINRSTTYLGLGRTLLRRGQDPGDAFEKAVEDCETVLRSNPNMPGVWVNRGTAFKELGDAEKARGADASSFRAKALDSFEKAVRIDPRFWRGYVAKGNLLEEAGRYAEALQAYEKALRIVGDRLPALKQWISEVREKAAKGK